MIEISRPLSHQSDGRGATNPIRHRHARHPAARGRSACSADPAPVKQPCGRLALQWRLGAGFLGAGSREKGEVATGAGFLAAFGFFASRLPCF